VRSARSIGRALRLAIAGLCLASLCFATAVRADDYPSRPIRLIVGFAAGGPTDILARVMAQHLSPRLGQQVLVENRPGAGGNTATELVVNAAPDGYTVLVIVTANVINTTFYRKLPFDFMRDVAPVAGLARISYIMAVHPSVPARTVAEFIDHAKANPGRISFASGGVGSSNHLSGELFRVMAGIDIVHVPYRGNAAVYSDLLSGRVQLMFADIGSSLAHVRSGALRGLAVTSRTPLPTLPEMPTVAATVAGYEASAWYGFGVPRATPAEIVVRLNREINAALANPAVLSRLRELEAEPLVFSPAAFAAFMAAEAVHWGRAVEIAGVRGD
jgi:tripartite-type tricarboxylate transporter receptor subunit TctC